MKKLFILFIFIISGMISHAQDTTGYRYCEIVGTTKMFTSNINVLIDFGQEKHSWTWFKDQQLRDSITGKQIEFNSMMDALNYMGKCGWEFIQAYDIGSNNYYVYHFILKKPVKKLIEEERRIEKTLPAKKKD